MNPFGVEHEISKAKNDEPSLGRKATAGTFGAYHGLVAGKKGSKLKSAGTELGVGTAGALIGRGVGSLAKNPAMGAKIGGVAGGVVGSVKGGTIAHKKGWLKPEKVKKSAFDVDHEISKAIRMPKTPKVQDRAVVNEKMKTMTGHLKRAKDLGKGK